MLSHPLAVAHLFLLCAPATAAQQGVLVVDATGGGDYTSVQAAVDAAFNRATVLIRAGIYPEQVVVAGKSLQLVEDAGAFVRISSVTVSGLPAGRDVYVSGIEMEHAEVGGDSAGEVLFERCFVESTATGTPAITVGGAAVGAARGATVVQGTLKGASGAFGLPGGSPGAMLDCERFQLYFSSAEGGDGGYFTDASCVTGCAEPGAAAVVSGTSDFSSLSSGFGGGLFGAGLPIEFCCGSPDFPQPPPAPDVDGMHSPITAPVTRLIKSAVLREGDPLNFLVTGESLAEVYLLASNGLDLRDFGPATGVLHLSLPLAFPPLPLGTLSLGGSLSFPSVAPDVAPGRESETWYYQILVLGDGFRYLSPPTGLVVLKGSL